MLKTLLVDCHIFNYSLYDRFSIIDLNLFETHFAAETGILYSAIFLQALKRHYKTLMCKSG